MRWLFFKGFLWNLGDFGAVVSCLIADFVGGDVAMVTASDLLAGGLEGYTMLRIGSVVRPCLLWRCGFWFWAFVDDGVLQLCGTV